MINISQLLADRKSGTPGPFTQKGDKVYIKSPYESDELLVIADFTEEADARRFARVPDLEQALIDAHQALMKLDDWRDEYGLEELHKMVVEEILGIFHTPISTQS